VQNPALVLAGLAVNQIALAMFAGRMQGVLRIGGVHIGFGSALRIHLQSMFYFFLLPMTVGLEVARFLKIRRIDPTASLARLGTALLLDRAFGASSALLLALACLPFVQMNLPFNLSILWISLALGGAAAAALALLAWPRARGMAFALRDEVRGKGPALALLFGLSIAIHAVFALGVYWIALGLGLPIAFLHTLLAVAGGMLLVAIPVSLAGLGPADAGVVALLIALGYDPAVALAAGALPYLARLVGAIEGGVWEVAEGGVAAVAATRQLASQRQGS
jgi:uncharacterized membrane protein YbhN (UPF0104 family)